jgi:hypothetical protein
VAIREKTITYAFPMTTATVADAVVTTLTQITVEIPEASPTFVSVMAEVGFQDIVTATGGTITEHRVALRLGGAAYTTITELDDIVNTAENIAGVIGPYDFTSHFTTNWTGTSMTCDAQVYFDQSTGTTLGMVNVTFLVHITYTYDDTAATQIKTVRIPLESLAGALPTAAANFGTNQIPQLTSGGILPENSPVIVGWFLQIEGNEARNNTTTDFTISANIDGGTATAFGNQESGLASDRFCRWIYSPSVPDPTTAHNLQMWISAGAVTRVNCVTVTLVVTYKFTLAGTTRVLNSVLLPIELPSPLSPTGVIGDAGRFKRNFIVPEPGTITLRQSGFRINWNANGGIVQDWRAGSQAVRRYTTLGNIVCGGFSLQQRIDSGSAQGAGITLARGDNDIVLDGYSFSGVVTNISGYIILNYESDVPAAGIGAAQHTIYNWMINFDAATNLVYRPLAKSIPITDANYWLTSVGLCITLWGTASVNSLIVSAEYASGEGPGAGWADLYADSIQTDGELGCTLIYVRSRDAFKRCPEDVDTSRMNVETARDLYLFAPAVCRFGVYWIATLHHCTYTVAANISGNDGALPTTLRLHLASNDEVLQEQVLSAGTTAFSFTVYDQRTYYVSAYQNNTRVGRSGDATPT